MKMSERIRSHIIDSGLKFSFVAERSGINVKTFSGMMNNRQRITTEEYELICTKGLGINPSYFFDKKFLETKNSA